MQDECIRYMKVWLINKVTKREEIFCQILHTKYVHATERNMTIEISL